jgi:transcription elongation GreA/GreB family factor
MGSFFVAIGAGIIELEAKKFMTISPEAPIGQLIMGKTAAETFDFRGKTHKIMAIS